MKMQKTKKQLRIYGQKWITPWITPGSPWITLKRPYYQKVDNKSKFYVEWITRITLFCINLNKAVAMVG